MKSKMVCVCKETKSLTYGKIYNAFIFPSDVVVKNNNNRDEVYDLSKFVTIKEWRERQIDDLFNPLK